MALAVLASLRLVGALCNLANSLFSKLREAKRFPRRCLAQGQLSQLRKGEGSLESFCWSNGGRFSSAAKPRSKVREDRSAPERPHQKLRS